MILLLTFALLACHSCYGMSSEAYSVSKLFYGDQPKLRSVKSNSKSSNCLHNPNGDCYHHDNSRYRHPTAQPTRNENVPAEVQTADSNIFGNEPQCTCTCNCDIPLCPTPNPTERPTERPTADPTERPTARPTERPTADPTERPTARPTEDPTPNPTERPTSRPTSSPTSKPTPGFSSVIPATPPSSNQPTSTPTSNPVFNFSFFDTPTLAPGKQYFHDDDQH